MVDLNLPRNDGKIYINCFGRKIKNRKFGPCKNSKPFRLSI